MIVRWRGETVRVVKLDGARAQIARPGVGLRWVSLAQLENIYGAPHEPEAH